MIYFTAANEEGERIPHTGGANFGGMMTGNIQSGCADCHGPDGRGGIHSMHMEVMDAPDIRFQALSGESEEHDDDHAEEHAGYDIEDFHQAVVEGLHPNGDSLDRDMPRWQMDENDLSDLFEYLKRLE